MQKPYDAGWLGAAIATRSWLRGGVNPKLATFLGIIAPGTNVSPSAGLPRLTTRGFSARCGVDRLRHRSVAVLVAPALKRELRGSVFCQDAAASDTVAF